VRLGEPANTAYVAGSSLAFDGIAWNDISQKLHLNLVGWGVAGSSPWEWEPFQAKSPAVQVSFLVVSAYDLNEHFLCDFHASVVPIRDTVAQLCQCHADWTFAKRVLSQYPLTAVRILFPTAGRSQGVLSGVRDRLLELRGKSTGMESDSGPTLELGATESVNDAKSASIRTWTPAKMLRRQSLLRAACAGRHDFNGPKHEAFVRMLGRAVEHGETVIIVLPVSASYGREFLGESVRTRFNQALAETQQNVPGARWIRLDQVPELNSDDYFWDLVHMNRRGQQTATKIIMESCN
jgi:hypothetical protein